MKIAMMTNNYETSLTFCEEAVAAKAVRLYNSTIAASVKIDISQPCCCAAK